MAISADPAPNKPQLDPERCSACGICVVACPFSCIQLKPSTPASPDPLLPVIADSCTACGACVTVCPSLSLSL